MPPGREDQSLATTDDAVKYGDAAGGDDDATVDTTCADSCHSSPASASASASASGSGRRGRYYGSLNNNSSYFHSYPESMFLVDFDETPSRVVMTNNVDPRWSASLVAHRMTPRPITRISKEPWYRRFRESNAVMWLGHFTFIAGASCYLEDALIDLTWARFSLIDNVIPVDVLGADDDVAWTHWEKTSLDKSSRHAVEDMREHYYDYSSLFCVLGGAFFVLCGLTDLMYYCECVDVFMIFAGIAGVLSGMSDTDEMEGKWNFISCHMYLLEAYVMIRRQRQDIDKMGETYDGHYFFLFSRMCFLGGCLLDIVTSYVELTSWESGWLDVYSDLISCSLWMACALIDFGAEMYFLDAEDEVMVVEGDDADEPLILSA